MTAEAVPQATADAAHDLATGIYDFVKAHHRHLSETDALKLTDAAEVLDELAERA